MASPSIARDKGDFVIGSQQVANDAASLQTRATKMNSALARIRQQSAQELPPYAPEPALAGQSQHSRQPQPFQTADHTPDEREKRMSTRDVLSNSNPFLASRKKELLAGGLLYGVHERDNWLLSKEETAPRE